MGHSASSFDKLLTSEMTKLVPLLNGDEIAYLLAHIEPLLKDHAPLRPSTGLDLEQLQIGDYASLYADAQDVRDILDLIQSYGTYDERELDFLALRSLVTLNWREPKSNEDVAVMAKVETALHFALIRVAEYIRSRHPERRAWLPYWARLAHINLVKSLPEPLQKQFGPDGIPCFVFRSRDINAHTFPLSNRQAIGLDYALEPFLKNINGFLYSYYGSRLFAGPKRIPRAFKELLPRVMFFKGLTPAYRVPSLSILFGQPAVGTVKGITDAQITFLIAHEIGHIALEHPSSRATAPTHSGQTQAKGINHFNLEHTFEYEADAFAMEWQRSKVLNDFRYFLHPKRRYSKRKWSSTAKSMDNSLNDYAYFHLGVGTLFLVIHVLDAIYKILTKKVEGLASPPQIMSHPAPVQRWARLQTRSICDLPMPSEFYAYSKELLGNVIEYASGLPAENVQALIKEVLEIEHQN
jgi:hypothetical protein